MLEENLCNIQKEIDDALSKRKERKNTGEKVQLIAVSKTQSPKAVRAALAAGIKIFGENKVQEAAEKIPLVNGGEWHLIGHLQTNKVKKAVELFELIYSVDSGHLMIELNQAAAKNGKIQDILWQFNIAKEESKSGFDKEILPKLLVELPLYKNLRLRGVMVIAPEFEDAELARPVFEEGYGLFKAILAARPENALIDTLSMGMSGDFKVAIEEGANNIRLGTAIFGKRDYTKL